MFYHPAYPSSADLAREHGAEAHDVADLVALRDLHGIVADAIARAGRIQHPGRRWTTADLMEALQDELANIDDTAAMIRRSPLVLEEAS